MTKQERLDALLKANEQQRSNRRVVVKQLLEENQGTHEFHRTIFDWPCNDIHRAIRNIEIIEKPLR